MSKINTKRIKEHLIAEREAIADKLRGKDLSVDESETPDPVDLAVRNYSKNVMLSVSENETRQLTMINDALDRIEDDEYGICQNCEKNVNPKRLNALPWAMYCIECQALKEQGLLDED